MAAPDPSRLDANQVLQGSFDETTGRLRTDAEATIVNADIDVSLDAAEDSVESYVVDENGNPFTDANYLPAGQTTHDNLNANANLQVNNTDVSNANPIPISDGGSSITVDGSVSVSNFPAIQPISAASLPLPTGASTSALQTAGNASLTSIDGKLPTLINGKIPVLSEETHPDTTVITSLNAAVTNQTALLANPDRKGAIIYRAGTGICYLKLGTTASITDYTIQMTNNTVYELPFPCYTGRIDVIFSSNNGTIKITEIT